MSYYDINALVCSEKSCRRQVMKFRQVGSSIPLDRKLRKLLQRPSIFLIAFPKFIYIEICFHGIGIDVQRFRKKSFRCCGSFCACSASFMISSGRIVTPYPGFAISCICGSVKSTDPSLMPSGAQHIKMKYCSSFTVPFRIFRQYFNLCPRNNCSLSPAVDIPIISLLVYAFCASLNRLYCFGFFKACSSSTIAILQFSESCASGFAASARIKKNHLLKMIPCYVRYCYQ